FLDRGASAFAPVGPGFVSLREVPKSERPDGGYDVSFVSADGRIPPGHGPFADRLEAATVAGTPVPVPHPPTGTTLAFRTADPNTAVGQYAAGEKDCRTLASNSDGVFWTRFGEGIVRMRDRSSLTTDIASGELEPYGLAADGTGVYWLTGNGTLRRWSAG